MAAAGIEAVARWAGRASRLLERSVASSQHASDWTAASLHSPLLHSAQLRLPTLPVLPWPATLSSEEPDAVAGRLVAEFVDRAASAQAAAATGQGRTLMSAVLQNVGRKLADPIVAQELAAIETWSGGKPISQALDDVAEASRCFLHFSDFSKKLQDGEGAYGVPRETPGYDVTATHVAHDPLGVCAAIVPFNFPLLIASWKVAPALAFGNALILKPSEYTPLSAIALQAIVEDAITEVTGEGDTSERFLYQVLPGDKHIGSALASEDAIALISFTGSTAVGKDVQRSVAQSDSFRRCILELGGSAPAIVCADADLDVAAENIFQGMFMNMGQNCCAVSRVLAHEDIAMSLVLKLSEKVSSDLRIGDPFDPETTYGPLLSRGHALRMKSILKETYYEGLQFSLPLPSIVRYAVPGAVSGEEETARETVNVPVFDGEVEGVDDVDRLAPPIGDEYHTCFVKPALRVNLDDDTTLGMMEVFGPIGRVMTPFRDLGDAVERANATEYGLAGGVFTQSEKTASEVARKLDCGNVWVNTWNWAPVQAPFSGRKDSGFGTNLGAEEALHAWTSAKSITVSADQSQRKPN